MTSAQIGFPVDPKFGLGLNICIAHGRGFVESLHSQGSVFEWNTYTAPELQICPGDRIDAWRVKGKPETRLTAEKELDSVCKKAIVLSVTKPLVNVVSVVAPFGIKTKKDDCDKAFFLISSIAPSGSVQKWNDENPHALVSVGDIIMGINGVRCTAREVPKLLGSAGHTVVELMVLHYLPRV